MKVKNPLIYNEKSEKIQPELKLSFKWWPIVIQKERNKEKTQSKKNRLKRVKIK